MEICVSILTLKHQGRDSLVSRQSTSFWLCDLPLSSLQLLLMPVSGLIQDGPPVGNSRSSLPTDQLTSNRAAKIRCEIKYLILIVYFSGGRSQIKKFPPILGRLVVRTLSGIVLRQTATFAEQMQKRISKRQ